MSDSASNHTSQDESSFSPPILRLLETLDNFAHVVVAALFIVMAATVLIHTCILLTRQAALVTTVPNINQSAPNSGTERTTGNRSATVPGRKEAGADQAIEGGRTKTNGDARQAESDQARTDDPAKAEPGSPNEAKPHEANTNLEDPFYRESLTLLSSILFAVIILELLRTIITYLQTHDIQAIMQEFLVVGIISSVRKILLVGAAASLSGSSGIDFIQEALGVMLNIAGILLLILGLYLLRRGVGRRDESR